ncbi:uncharacterized protein [Ptychodera flava]|uniref:uncharacterized protein n=1 Tax=Ptychodera flava TaxID=63121 RepID=UPI00396A086F
MSGNRAASVEDSDTDRLTEAVRACKDAINNAASLLQNITHRDHSNDVHAADRPSQSRGPGHGRMSSTDIVREFRDNFARGATTCTGRRRSQRVRWARSREQRADNVTGRSTGMTPTWTRAFVCLDSIDFEWCPSPTQRADLAKLGLVERRVKIPVVSTASEVHEQLLDEYPKLSEGGGYEICRAYPGSRRLNAISCPNEGYSQRYLSIEAGQAKLYIRPLQNNLERTPDVTVTAPQIWLAQSRL